METAAPMTIAALALAMCLGTAAAALWPPAPSRAAARTILAVAHAPGAVPSTEGTEERLQAAAGEALRSPGVLMKCCTLPADDYAAI